MGRFFYYVIDGPNFPIVLLLWTFFVTMHPHVVDRSSTSSQHLKHNKTQSNQPARSRKASTCRSECDNASQQAEHPLCCSTASRAQHNAISPHKAVKQVLADQSVTTQASRPELARASTCQQLISTLHSQNEPRSKNLPGVQYYTTMLTQRW